MTLRKEFRKFNSTVEGIDGPDISAASYISKQCYGCPQPAELRRRIAVVAWEHNDLLKGHFNRTAEDGNPEQGRDTMRIVAAHTLASARSSLVGPIDRRHLLLHMKLFTRQFT